ncbi:cyclin-D3-1-like isoform X2 [Mangifera indica]|uniref:cyclin-D3-1-like isoform X2 n=1 Tax=Mangifera indica TaxID=29780 RepID=UPI001CFAFA78|nr:cyclin-D3-1-like isoform X2 [Mangifera indica]
MAKSNAQQNPAFLLDALYCSEENWEEEVSDDYFQEDNYCFGNNESNQLPILLEQDLFWEDDEASTLLSKEEPNLFCKNPETDPALIRARRDAVEWMLKVNAHHSFSALTAILAVNYLDRLLFSFHFQRDKPWMTQLVAVACLFLAAKVEETQVPLLLDLQVEGSKYVFEAKTIQRMEILVLSTLKWKMNPVTPLAFLDFFARRFGLKDYVFGEFRKRCERIILSLISDSRFMHYLPSVMATAAMLHVVESIEPCLGVDFENQLFDILAVDKDQVEKLKLKLAMEGYGNKSNKRKFGSVPGSPNGVMDVSFSSDTSNDSWPVALSVSSSPEPLSKKSRAEDLLMQRQNHANVSPDFLTVPR